jgi:polysaccharide export outer membrane protein
MPNKHYPLYRLIFLFSLSLLFTSCAKQRDFVYFQRAQNDSIQVIAATPHTIQLVPGDVLTITVAAVDPDVVKPFNLTSNTSKVAAESTIGPSYLIDDMGNIDFPVLGNIKLAGLTSAEATKVLKDRIKSYVTNPIISLKIQNHKVTILGDVKSPGVIPIPNERLTLTDALALAGDLQISGIRKNILVVREVNGVKTETRVDITSRHLFSSPIYYLKNNDLIYVEPNKAKIQSSKGTLQYASLAIGSLSLVINILNILSR